MQVSVKAIAGDSFGEIGVFCQMPQPYTVRTREISQILRLNRTALIHAMRSNRDDGPIVVNNFFMVKRIIRHQKNSSSFFAP